MTTTPDQIAAALTALRQKYDEMRLLNNQVVSDKLKALSEAGMSANAFAKRYGYSSSYLSRVATKQVHVSPDMARRIIADLDEALECSTP